MSDRQRHQTAVALCCDRRYFPFALFVIRQIAFHNPFRSFDLVISTGDDLRLPGWAAPLDIQLHRPSPLPDLPAHPRLDGKAAYLYRLLLARDLGDRYRRILYLDCDMFVEGGDLARLLAADLGPHPVAMVLDAPFLYEPQHLAKEYRKLGLAALPYGNSGLQLIDTQAFREQEVERRAFDQVRAHPEAIVLADQSMINLALRGRFAQLAPCWNWQWNARLPLVPMRYPVFLRHFIGPGKPDRVTSRHLDARFNLAYREFLTRFAPELLPTLALPADPAPMGLRQASQIVLRHHQVRKLVEQTLARHPDPYRALH